MNANSKGNQLATVLIKQNGNLVAARVRDNTKMNPQELFGTMVNEDP